MKKKDFVHLHLHSHFSLNDGIEGIERIVNKCYEQGMQTLALTDHNSLAGAVEFTKKCIEKEIKPILGCEINLASGRKTKHNSNIFHLTLLIENESGYKNLVKLITRAHQRKRSKLPYITYEELKENKRGLIALTGCERGELISAIIENRAQDSEETFKDLLNIFTKENIYIELQNYQSYSLIDINKILVELANFLELSIVATQNVHYLEKEDRILYEFIKSNNPESNIASNPVTVSLSKRDKSFFSTDEIYRIFSYLPDAIDNSLEIAQRCNFLLNVKKKRYFKHDLGRGFDSDSYLLDFISKELDKKYPELDKKTKERLNYELQLIKEEEISNSFLILIAIQKFLTDNKIEAYTSRDWLTFSLVAFLIGLNNINPEMYKTHFDSSQISKNRTLEIEIEIASEFLNPLVNYIFKSYSNLFVCMEGEYLYWNKEELIKSFHNWIINRNKKNLLSESNNIGGRFIEHDMLGLTNQTLTEEQIEGYLERLIEAHLPLPVALSQTETNILFSGEPLSELIPIEFLTPHLSVSQYNTNATNELGIIRINLKKNISLDILNNAIYFIKQDKIDFTLKKIPLTDGETFSLLSRGNTNGIPFFHNIKIKSELKSVKPQSYNQLLDICYSFFGDKLPNAEIIQNVYISYCLAHLKIHYSTEFYASALTHYFNSLNSYNILVKETKNSGIRFLPIDINFSEFKFSIQGDAIRTGLCIIKNFTSKAHNEIDNIRKGGLFDSLIDLTTKTDQQIVTKDVLKNLIMAGALENLNSDRYTLLNQLENIPEFQRGTYQSIKKSEKIDEKQGVEMLSSWLDLEYDATGTTLSQGLLDYYLPFSKMIGAIEPEEFQNVSHREQTSVLGLFDNFEENGSIKKDNFICLDFQGIEVRISEEIFLKDKEHIDSDLPVLVVGRKIIGERGEYLFAKRIYDIRKLVELAEAPHILELDLSEANVKKQKQLLKILNQYRGKHKIIIKTLLEVNKGFQKRIEKQMVLSCPNLINELGNLLGEENVKIRLDFANK